MVIGTTEEKGCQRVGAFLFHIRVVREGLAENIIIRKKPRGNAGASCGVSEGRML